MLSARAQQVALECWNCDQTVAEVIKAKLQALSGRSSVVELCQPCFVTVYLPLVADGRDLVAASSRSRSVSRM